MIRSKPFSTVFITAMLASGATAGILSLHSDAAPKESAPSTANPAFYNPNIFVELAKKVTPSVVNISTLTTIKGRPGPGGPGGEEAMRRFFEEFFGGIPGGPRGGGPIPGPRGGGEDGTSKTPKAMSLGSGFVIDTDGLILTNNHVVQEADEIKIHFTEDPNEEPTEGKVVGRDPELDLALIRVKTDRKLTAAVLGDSDALQVGEYVMAVGNPVGYGHSVTHGIISAKDRKAPDFLLGKYLQTDAPINPGNSGGPLVSLKGEVIGINNAIDARSTGIGFAIPIALVKKVLPQLTKTGSVARGFLGVGVQELSKEIAKSVGLPENTMAPIVTNVQPGYPAEKAGIRSEDVILEVNGEKVRTAKDLTDAVTSIPVGTVIKVKIFREGQGEKTLSVTLAKRPVEGLAGVGGPGGPDIRAPKKPGEGSKLESMIQMSGETLTPSLARKYRLPESTKGVLITGVLDGGVAAKENLQEGQIITHVGQKAVESVADLEKALEGAKGKILRFKVTGFDEKGEKYTFLVPIKPSK
jgi:serine protease Do